MIARRPLDTLALLQRLAASGVDFVIVGGIAAIAHGSAVTTQDLDVCASLTEPNARAIIGALQDVRPRWRMRMDLPPVDQSDHRLAAIKDLYLTTDLGQLDVLGESPDVCGFDELARTAESIGIGGRQYKLIDLDTLIATKRVAGRPQDLRTLPFLEQIKRSRRQP